MLLAFLGGSSRSAGGSDHNSFHVTSALGLTVCEILCATFKGKVFDSHSPLDLPKVSPTGLQIQMF